MLFSRSVVSDSFETPWAATHKASLSFTLSQSLLKFMFIESVMPSNHLILCCPLHSFPASGSFPSELTLCITWPKYWSLNFSISPSNEYSRLVSFRIDWFDLLAAQGTLKSLLQCHNSVPMQNHRTVSRGGGMTTEETKSTPAPSITLPNIESASHPSMQKAPADMQSWVLFF